MKNTAKLFVVAMLVSSVTFGATILHYDFEDGTPGVPMNDFPVTQQNGTVGTADLSGNDYHMHAWDDYWGPLFSAEGDTPSGAGLSSVHDTHRDGYTLADGIRDWSPSTWTIELSFKLNDPSGWKTLIGRDDWTGIEGDIGPSLQVQSNGIDDAMRVAFATVSDEHYELFSSLIPEPGKWYHLAVVTDGDQLDMYADQFDGNGFQNIGSLTMNPGIDHSLRPTGNWTFGRGWYDGNFVDHIDGNMDNIRFSDEALTTDQLIQIIPTVIEKAGTPYPADGAVDIPLDTILSWTADPRITQHFVYLLATPADPNAAPAYALSRVALATDVNDTDGTFVPAELIYDTTYLWAVDLGVNGSQPYDPNTIKGDTWTFTTISDPNIVE
ncbi:MAG: LamG-like jellyroll fold domain-containing protein [Planctomycetota bacterium]